MEITKNEAKYILQLLKYEIGYYSNEIERWEKDQEHHSDLQIIENIKKALKNAKKDYKKASALYDKIKKNTQNNNK